MSNPDRAGLPWWRRWLSALALRTPKQRLVTWAVLSLLIFMADYSWLAHLSLWERLGWRSAPSIGLTRAYWLVLHGRWHDAWQRNRLIVPVLVIGGAMLAVDAWRLLRPVRTKA